MIPRVYEFRHCWTCDASTEHERRACFGGHYWECCNAPHTEDAKRAARLRSGEQVATAEGGLR